MNRRPRALGATAVHLVRRAELQSRLLRELPPAHRLASGDDGAVVPSPDGIPVAADHIVLGRVPTKVARVRAMYRDAGYTLAVHGNLIPFRRRTHLIRGARTLAKLRPECGIRIPRPLEWRRNLRSAWVVEEFIDGSALEGAAWRAAAPDAARGLTDMWARLGPGSAARGQSGEEDVAALGRLLSRDEVRDHLAGPATDDLLARATERVAARGPLTMAWCHGDPVGGNWLRTTDGQLALIDWEFARWRPVGHDAVRVILGLDHAVELADEMATSLAPERNGPVTPWRDQLALALIRWLSWWERDHAKARRSGTLERFWRRAMQRVTLLDQLTR
jgi:hypothetical protein